jgi:[histone H3]-lysine4/36 N-trimethyltransferase SMYD
MAAKFRVVEDPRKGRAAIASTRLPAGSQLLSAEAFAAVSLTACNWCFTTLSVRRCSGCQLIHYCSRPCQQLDWTRGGHGKECAGAWKRIPRERASQTVLLVARVAAKLLLGDTVDGGEDAVLDLRHHYGTARY